MAKTRTEQRAVGSRFTVSGFGRVRVVHASYEACACCAFRNVRCTEIKELGPCTFRDRHDHQNVIFRLIYNPQKPRKTQ